MFTKHVLIAKSVVTLLIGALFGYAIAGNVARDAARGRALTKDAYVADFERFKAKLERSEEHTSELQSHSDLVCRLLLEKKKTSATRPAVEDADAPATAVRGRKATSR